MLEITLTIDSGDGVSNPRCRVDQAPRVLWPRALCRVPSCSPLAVPRSGHPTGPGRRRPPYLARAIAAPP